MQKVKHIQFLEVSFNTAIFALKLIVSTVSAELLNAQVKEASTFIQHFTSLQKEKLTTFLTPTYQNIQPVTLHIVRRI
jgi:hypothetical protein